jgi:hypothetical protein
MLPNSSLCNQEVAVLQLKFKYRPKSKSKLAVSCKMTVYTKSFTPSDDDMYKMKEDQRLEDESRDNQEALDRMNNS